MKRVLIVAAIAATLVGCSNVKAETFTPSNHDQVFTDISKSHLSDDEKALMVGAIARNAMGSYPLDGKTVGQILDEQKQFVAQQDAEARAQKEAQEKEAARVAAIQASIRQAVTVAILSKHYQEFDFENRITQSGTVLKIQFHNTGNKAIRAFKGQIEFDNQFGDKITTTNIDREDPIKPGEIQTDSLINEYGDAEIRTKPLDQMKVKWIPTAILFADGTKLSTEP